MTFILRPNLMFDSRAHYSWAEPWPKRKDYIDKRLPGMRLTAGSIKSQHSRCWPSQLASAILFLSLSMGWAHTYL